MKYQNALTIELASRIVLPLKNGKEREKAFNHHKKLSAAVYIRYAFLFFSCALFALPFALYSPCPMFIAVSSSPAGCSAGCIIISYDPELCVRTQPIAKFSFIFICAVNLLYWQQFFSFALLCSFFIISPFTPAFRVQHTVSFF